LFVFPFRTTLSHQEDPSVGAGIASGLGGNAFYGSVPVNKNIGKKSTLVMPAIQDEKSSTEPEASSWNIRQGAANYYNRYFYEGGRRFIQVTLSTVGKTQWFDHTENVHQSYAPNPVIEWTPTTDEGTLEPAWDSLDSFRWRSEIFFPGVGDIAQFPDVYRTWIMRGNIDLVTVWSQDPATPGYRMFFQRDRQVATHLLTRIFKKAFGTFRDRPEKLAMGVWRAYEGIDIVNAEEQEDRKTAYGDDSTVGDPILDRTRWFKALPTYKILTDGRIGFQLSIEGRTKTVKLEDKDIINNFRSPWSWNGLQAVNREIPYEMFWTFAMEVDENLFEFNALKEISEGEMPLDEFGPPMELQRTADEYGEERVITSAVDHPLLGSITRIPSLGTTTIYRNGAEEITARNQMMMNRHARVDTEAKIVLPYIDMGLKEGQLVQTLEVPNGENIEIGSIIASIDYDFLKQQTVLNMANIR